MNFSNSISSDREANLSENISMFVRGALMGKSAKNGSILVVITIVVLGLLVIGAAVVFGLTFSLP
jgi:hypothetical protein